MGILKSRADFGGCGSFFVWMHSLLWVWQFGSTGLIRQGEGSVSIDVSVSHSVSEGNSPSGAVLRAAYLYSVGSEGPNHDAIIRIGGEVPG